MYGLGPEAAWNVGWLPGGESCLTGIQIDCPLAPTWMCADGHQVVQHRTGNHARFAWNSPAVIGRQLVLPRQFPAHSDQVCIMHEVGLAVLLRIGGTGNQCGLLCVCRKT